MFPGVFTLSLASYGLIFKGLECRSVFCRHDLEYLDSRKQTPFLFIVWLTKVIVSSGYINLNLYMSSCLCVDVFTSSQL